MKSVFILILALVLSFVPIELYVAYIGRAARFTSRIRNQMGGALRRPRMPTMQARKFRATVAKSRKKLAPVARSGAKTTSGLSRTRRAKNTAKGLSIIANTHKDVLYNKMKRAIYGIYGLVAKWLK